MKVKLEDLPLLDEWVGAATASEIAGVSRQHLHAILHEFPGARNLDGWLVLPRADVEAWAAKRAEKLGIKP